MRIVIVGTGTDVGKTHVTCCLLAYASAHRLRAAAYKPIASGVDGQCDDAQRHADAFASSYVSPSFSYRRPVSPHLAAREEGRPIELDTIRSRADELAATVELLIVETAGGLLTPLGPSSSNLDLVKTLLPAALLLVAPDRLGVLHDVGVCQLAARAAGLPITMTVLSAPHQADASTGTNGDELALIGRGPVGGVFPRAAIGSRESLRVAELLFQALTISQSAPL